MAVGETTSSEATVHTTERVPAGCRVRHFDQLSEPEQVWLVEALDGDAAGGPPATFRDGEVVVFTDYLRVHTA